MSPLPPPCNGGGGTTKAAPSTKQGGDTNKVTKKTPHLEQGGVTDMTEDNFCDDLNLRFDDLPLPDGREQGGRQRWIAHFECATTAGA